MYVIEKTPPVASASASADAARASARRDRLRTASVFFFAAAFFLLLASGHIYARDEETLYQMADGVARHGEPLVSPDDWGIVDSTAPSKHGLRPTSYAPGQPVLAVPWYWAGDAVGALGGSASAVYLSRFVTLTFNGFVTAATAALLFRFALAFGYRARVGVALAVCFGVATFALVLARTFFSEPLTAFLVLLAFFLLRQACGDTAIGRRHGVLLAGSGCALAAALLVKVHAALFVPVLTLFLLCSAFPSARSLREPFRRRLLVWRALWWGGGAVLPVAALLLYNTWLYGGPFTTGYGDTLNVFPTPLLTGLYGLLFSSGKGVLWFAPPLLFAAMGSLPFARRFPREAIAILCAALINLLFYARLEIWSGDGAWGPRYLLIVLPWLLLPALPVLDRLLAPGRGYAKTFARAGAVAVVLFGALIQSLGIAVSFDVPLLTNPNNNARYFSPAQSPIVLSYRTARSRFTVWWAEHHPPVNTFRLGDGLYPPEGDHPGHFPRWTNGDAVVTLNPADGAALHIKLTYFDHRPDAMRATATPVMLALGAEGLAPVDRLSIAPANEGFILAYDLPAALVRSAGHRLVIRTPTWNPALAGAGDRDEPLGIFVNNLEVWADGAPMRAEERTTFPPAPATPRNVWLWANYPNYPHLLDWWPVLLHDAGLPGRLAAGIAAGMLAAVASLCVGGGYALRRSLRMRPHGGNTAINT